MSDDWRVMAPPCDSHVVSPRKMPMVPSVAMNGSMRPRVVMSPLARPQAAPMATASAPATMSMVIGSLIEPPFMNRIIRLATNAVMAPTERSRPPAEMTKVAPTADDGSEGGAGQHVDQVADGEEAPVGERADDQQDGERHEGRHRRHVDPPEAPFPRAVLCRCVRHVRPTLIASASWVLMPVA